MKLFIYSVLASTLVFVGCSQKPLEVVVTPTEYRVSEIASPLATPVVDEVVKLNPKHVILIQCPNTPNTKIFQFDTELVARISPKIQIAKVSEGEGGCPK